MRSEASKGLASVGAASRSDTVPWAARSNQVLVLICLVLPWLLPFAGGPSTAVQPWLFSVLCAAFAFGTQRKAALRVAAWGALAWLAAWGALRSGLAPESVALAASCLLVAIAGNISAGASDRSQLSGAIALGWLVAAALSTAVGLIQYFGLADRLAPWVSASAAGEAFGNLRQRNQFASLTAIGMASLFWLVPGRLKTGPAVVVMAWLALGNAATTSRTGLVQILMLGLLACIWPGPRRQRAVLLAAGFLAYAVAAVVLPWLLETLAGVPGNRLWERVAAVDSCSSRAVLWSNVLHLIGQRPWLGWGWGELDYAHYATLYAGHRFCDILDNAHNLPLHLAVELGIPAALIVCGGFAWVVARARAWQETEPVRQMAWAVLVVIGLHSLLEYPLWYGPFQIAFGLCLGLLWPAAKPGPAGSRAGSAALQRGTALLLLAGVVYAAWDYRRVSQIYLPPEARAQAYQSDPMSEIRQSWLFRNQARFAELTVTALTRDNAQWTFDTAAELLHYSPEPRVIEKLIESGVALGRSDELLLHLARFRAAFPDAYAAWSQRQPGGALTRP